MYKKNIIVNKRLIHYLFLFCIATAQMQEVNAIGGRLFYFLAGHVTGLYAAHKHLLEKEANNTFYKEKLDKNFLSFATSVVKKYPIVKDIADSSFIQNLSKSITAEFVESEKTAKEEIKK